jgi:hypothetical protein
MAGFLDEREVDGVVNGQLDGVASGQRHDIDSAMGDGSKQSGDREA